MHMAAVMRDGSTVPVDIEHKNLDPEAGYYETVIALEGRAPQSVQVDRLICEMPHGERRYNYEVRRAIRALGIERVEPWAVHGYPIPS